MGKRCILHTSVVACTVAIFDVSNQCIFAKEILYVIHGDKVHRIIFRTEALLLSWRYQHRILDCLLFIWKGRVEVSSVNSSSLNLVKTSLINFTGLSKHFSYFWMRKQVGGNYLRCVIDRTVRDGQYKCHHMSINLVGIFMFLWLK